MQEKSINEREEEERKRGRESILIDGKWVDVKSLSDEEKIKAIKKVATSGAKQPTSLKVLKRRKRRKEANRSKRKNR